MKTASKTKADLIKENKDLGQRLKEAEEKLLTYQKNEAALHSAKKTARSILNQSTEVIIICDENGKIIQASQVAHRYFTAKLLRRPFDSMCPLAIGSPSPLQPRQFSISSVLAGKIFRSQEVTYRHDGQVSYFLLSARPLIDKGGRIVGSVVTLTDITERKQIEENLRKSRDELEIRVQERTAELAKQSKILEGFFTSTITPLVFLDRNFNFIRVNEAYAKACQRDISEFSGHNHFEFYPSDAKEIFEQVVETKVPYQAIARPFTFLDRPEWGETYRNWNLTPLLDETGEVEYLVFSLEDVTERKRAEEALAESENRLRSLSSQLLTAQESERRNIARELHDGVGQMLTAVKFKVENVLQEIGERNPKGKSLEAVIPMIRESMEEVRRIQTDLRPSVLDDLGILAALSWLCRNFGATYSHIHIEKETEIQEEGVPALLKTVIYRISQEALNNVAKHSKADLVRLSLGKAGNRIELRIEDNGRGFNLEKILSQDKDKRGLGLNSMRERAELSGGAFAIESTKGKGATIKVSWPL